MEVDGVNARSLPPLPLMERALLGCLMASKIGFLTSLSLCVLGISIISWSKSSSAASFDCSNASTLEERIICSDPTLSSLDGLMGQDYFALRQITTNRRQLLKSQRLWLKTRQSCLIIHYARQSQIECMRLKTRDRIAYLRSELSRTGSQPRAQPKPPPSEPSMPRGDEPSFGTGFFVSRTGLILTNAHVVSGCDRVKINRFGNAEIMRVDNEVDLAALLVDLPTAVTTAIFAVNEPALGSSVIGGGYPLPDLLHNDFTVHFGKVTGRRGLGGTESLFSISAPVQPGNSGGPIVNSQGLVIGVIVSKLDDAKMLEVTGSTGANFSFAIDGEVARQFLRPFALEVHNPTLEAGARLSDEAIVANIERYTVQVLCSVD